MTDKPQRDAATELLIQEVDEDLRREFYTRLWKKYGGLALGVAVAIVVSVAGYQVWTSQAAQKRAQEAAAFNTAVTTAPANREQALAQLGKLAAESDTGYATLAPFARAALYEQAGDMKAAAGEFAAIAADADTPQLYRELAVLKGALLQLDTAEPNQIRSMVEPLANSGAWRHSATEVLALLALRQGDAAKARDIYRQLADDAGAPQGLRARAAEMLAALEAKTSKQG